MGTVIVSWNHRELIDKMAAAYSERSLQPPAGAVDLGPLQIRSFARLNGTGGKLHSDAHGNTIAILGCAGAVNPEEPESFLVDPAEILGRFLSLKDGPTFAHELWGNFVIVLYLRESGELKIIRDHSNSINFFAARCEDGFYFSNSSLALAEFLPVRPSRFGVANFFTFMAPFEDTSLFEGVEKLKPAAIYTYTSDGGSSESTYDTLPREPSKGKLDATHYAAMFDKALRLTGLYARRPGVDLTGGFDSRLVTAAAIHSKIDFVPCVHGEEDDEVRYVRNRIAGPLNLPCEVLRLGRGQISGFADKAVHCHYLFDGEYSIFDATKEGLRSLERLKAADAKVTGGIGEYLRDKWYKRFYTHRNPDELRSTLLEFFARFYCQNDEAELLLEVFTDEFRDFLLRDYPRSIKNRLCRELEDLSTNDVSYLYLYPAYLHYIRGWLGTLYNGHNRILMCSAPYLERSIVQYGLPASQENKRRAWIQLETTNHLCPELARIPFIDGTPGAPYSCRNAWRYEWAKLRLKARKLIRKLSRRDVDLNYKFDYDYRIWSLDLLADGRVQEALFSPARQLQQFIDSPRLSRAVQRAREGTLSRSHYRTLSRVITLALNLKISGSHTNEAQLHPPDRGASLPPGV